MMKKFFLFLLLYTPLLGYTLDNQPNEFANAAQEEQYQYLTNQFRCVVCQNQSVADSSAPLAQDIRDLVRTMIVEGKSNEEIKHFLVSRYGDFVLYQPPFKSTTYFLWLLPPILLLISLWLLRLFLKQQMRTSVITISEEEQQKIRQILKE